MYPLALRVTFRGIVRSGAPTSASTVTLQFADREFRPLRREPASL
jgi:hypothetical protein